METEEIERIAGICRRHAIFLAADAGVCRQIDPNGASMAGKLALSRDLRRAGELLERLAVMAGPHLRLVK